MHPGMNAPERTLAEVRDLIVVHIVLLLTERTVATYAYSESALFSSPVNRRAVGPGRRCTPLPSASPRNRCRPPRLEATP